MLHFFNDLYQEFIQQNISYKITTFVLPILVSWLIPFLYKKWNRMRIRILDTQLIYGTSPGTKLSFGEKIKLYPLLIPWMNISWLLLIWGALIAALVLGGMHFYVGMQIALGVWIVLGGLRFFIPLLLNRDSKGLVGILSSEFDEVDKSENNERDRIHLVHLKGEYNSYERRQPFTHIAEIEEVRKQCIESYYDDLQKDIDDKFKGKNHEMFMVDFQGERMHICHFLKEIAYSSQNLMDKVNEVTRQMKEEKRISFIGDKIGVYGYYLKNEKGKKKSIQLKTYLTDHFTFLVFKEIFHDAAYKKIFQLFIRRVNRVDEPVKEYMVRCLKFLFSSFGVDLIIHGRNAQGKQVMLVALRNGEIEREGHHKLHVPVNESFSNTDLEYDAGKSKSDLEECVKRGIIEELGIPKDTFKKTAVTFHDFAIVSDEGEIGMGCHIDFSSVMPIEEIRCYAGQDKYMEMKGLYEVPYPPFFWDANQYPMYFYQVTRNDIFSTPWESFTPLLYQRCIVRNLHLGKLEKLFLNFLFLLVGTSLLIGLFYDKGEYGSKWMAYVVTATITLVLNMLIYAVVQFYHWLSHYKYDYIMPLVPQWGGDVNVLQSNANIEKMAEGNDHINEHITFGLLGNPEKSFSINELKLEEKPYCYVRREITGQRESPISFYRTVQRREGDIGKRLLFYTVPCYTDENEIVVGMQIKFEKEKVSYHFILDLPESDVPELLFNEEIQPMELSNYAKYYFLNEKLLDSYKFAKLPPSFQSKYIPVDLMEYKDNFHWALKEKTPQYPNSTDIIRIHKNTNLYKDCIKSVKSEKMLWFKGNKRDVTEVLVTFITHPSNRKRIRPLDIYMLQLALVREGILLADRKKPTFKFVSEETQKRLYHWGECLEKILGL